MNGGRRERVGWRNRDKEMYTYACVFSCLCMHARVCACTCRCVNVCACMQGYVQTIYV